MSKTGSANGSFFGNFIYDQLLRRRSYFRFDLSWTVDFSGTRSSGSKYCSCRPSRTRTGLSLRGYSLSGPALRSLSLRPGDSLTIPWMPLSMGFRYSVALLPAIQVSGVLALTLARLTLAEHANRRWTDYGMRIGRQREHMGLQLLPVFINGGYPHTGAGLCLHMASNSLK
jgi:hypothetical protein